MVNGVGSDPSDTSSVHEILDEIHGSIESIYRLTEEEKMNLNERRIRFERLRKSAEVNSFKIDRAIVWTIIGVVSFSIITAFFKSFDLDRKSVV